MKTSLTILFSISFVVLFAQMDTIHFINPSFEGQPLEGGFQNSSFLKGWRDCGFRGETPPDVHPVRGGNFSVGKTPAHGNTYIGMVTRDNDTWEQISQKLKKPLKAGKCYSFLIDLARSEMYLSQSRLTGKPSNYVNPIKLRIHGGNEICGKEELLGETSLIKNNKWLTYSFIINPKEDYKYIVLEAFYDTPTLYPYNGNILVDNLSPIIEVSCNSDSIKAIIVETDKVRQVELGRTEVKNAAYEKRLEQDSIEASRMIEARKLDDIKRMEERRLANERKNASKILLSEKTKELTQLGLFDQKNKETIRNGADVLTDIIKLLKANPKLGVQIGVKKGKNRKWKISFLKETFHANGIKKSQYDIDKFSKFVDGIWEANNKNIAIDVFKIN